MITRSRIKEVLKGVEIGFSLCWEILAEVKKGKFETDGRISFAQFQPTLANAVFELTYVYRKIEEEKRALVKQKLKYNQVWFSKRMAFLSNEQKKLNSAIAIGKGIGDAFALFFYQRDRHFIMEHMAQPSQIHAPPGIGGAGELEFIKNISNINGYFVVYHGITNLLRLGDITLIDLKGFRVAAIGEIKTHCVNTSTLEISLFVSGPGLGQPQAKETLTAAIHGEASKSLSINLSPSGRDRLKRQLKRISESFKKLEFSQDKKIDIEVAGRHEDFSKFVTSLRSSRIRYSKLSTGLLICGYKERGKSLYQKLSPKKFLDVNTRLDGLEAAAASILARSSTDNSLNIRPFFYEDNYSTCHLPGMTHIAWWPIGDDVIRKILFQDVCLFTIYNAAHLIEKLKASGWNFEEKDNTFRGLKITKPYGMSTLAIEGISYYMSMIQQYFFSEDEVLALLAEAVKQIDSSAIMLPQTINLIINQQFGSPRV